MKIYLAFILLAISILKAVELQQPKKYDEQNITGWVMSEKLDGIRGFWNGKKMMTKKGYKIHLPDYFTKNFPSFALDGELWIDRDSYEEVQAIVLDDIPSNEWKKVTYNIFEVPNVEGNFTQRLHKARDWFYNHPNSFVKIVTQKKCYSKNELLAFLDIVVKKGGEGVIVKNPNLPYFYGRSKEILKVKKYSDAEAKIIEINSGKGKYHRMMGSLTVQMQDGTLFKVGTGFTKEERITPPKPGSIITFKYYGWTKNHKPKFATFMRVRDEKTIER